MSLAGGNAIPVLTIPHLSCTVPSWNAEASLEPSAGDVRARAACCARAWTILLRAACKARRTRAAKRPVKLRALRPAPIGMRCVCWLAYTRGPPSSSLSLSDEVSLPRPPSLSPTLFSLRSHWGLGLKRAGTTTFRPSNASQVRG